MCRSSTLQLSLFVGVHRAIYCMAYLPGITRCPVSLSHHPPFTAHPPTHSICQPSTFSITQRGAHPLLTSRTSASYRTSSTRPSQLLSGFRTWPSNLNIPHRLLWTEGMQRPCYHSFSFFSFKLHFSNFFITLLPFQSFSFPCLIFTLQLQIYQDHVQEIQGIWAGMQIEPQPRDAGMLINLNHGWQLTCAEWVGDTGTGALEKSEMFAH